MNEMKRKSKHKQKNQCLHACIVKACFFLQVKAGDRVVQTVEHTHQFDGTVADLDLLSIEPGQILLKFRKNLPEGNN